jgi:hypothetical protein
MYVIVEFEPDNDDVPTCDIAHESWLTKAGDKLLCYFPPYRNPARLAKAVGSGEVPGDFWTLSSCRTMKKYSKNMYVV